MALSVQALAKARRDRCLAQILRYAEHDAGINWKEDEWEDFRQTVLSALNSYHDVVLDMIRAIEHGNGNGKK